MEKYFKAIVGYLIEYYRKEKYLDTKDKRFQKVEFISYKSDEILKLCQKCDNSVCKEKTNICSYNTYLNVEKGKNVLNECIYIDLANKLELNYEFNHSKETILAKERKKTLEALSENNIYQMEKVYEYIKNNYNYLNNALYYSEIQNIYYSLLEIQLFQKYPSQKYINMLESFVTKLRKEDELLGTQLLFKFYRYCLHSPEKSNYYSERLIELDPDNIEFIMFNFVTKNTFLESYRYLKEIDSQRLTRYERYLKYTWLCFCYINLKQYNEAEIYTNKCKHLLEDENFKLPSREIFTTFMRKGLICYFLSDYVNSIIYFEKVITYDSSLLHMNIILYVDALEKTNNIDKIKSFINKLEFKSNNHFQKIWNYYKMKYLLNTSKKELIDYIVEELTKIIPKKSIYYEMYLNELLELCKETKEYKPLAAYLSN